MKEFNLEEAKAGKPVCTRCGESARIICWDANYGNGKILALVTEKDGNEYPRNYTNEGIAYSLYGDGDAGLDLMMAPEHHEAWMIVEIIHKKVGFVGKTIFYNYADAEACLKEEMEESGHIHALAHLEWED